METALIAAVAFVASGLTLFSGFGLGSILMPVMAIFFPVEVAISATALVHLANNIFKLALFGKHGRKDVILKFGLPAMAFAAAGAWTLAAMSELKPFLTYSWLGKEITVEWVKLVIALLIVTFSVMELVPWLGRLEFGLRLLPVGGVFSGFLGGLSGHQGAMRSAFLANAGLTREQFIGTGVTIACLVDVIRLTVYGAHLSAVGLENPPLILTACAAAFVGAYGGKKLVKKITMRQIQIVVAGGLFLLSLGLASGII